MNFHLSFTMGNNHEQAPKQQIDETEKICCDLENTLTIFLHLFLFDKDYFFLRFFDE